jgi:hypothetical protein
MWNDMDLSGSSATVQVRRTLSQTRTGHIFEKAKNGKGRSVKPTFRRYWHEPKDLSCGDDGQMC